MTLWDMIYQLGFWQWVGVLLIVVVPCMLIENVLCGFINALAVKWSKNK